MDSKTKLYFFVCIYIYIYIYFSTDNQLDTIYISTYIHIDTYFIRTTVTFNDVCNLTFFGGWTRYVASNQDMRST